jgi:hypothetical protein
MKKPPDTYVNKDYPLRQCCGQFPVENICGRWGRSYFELACKKCRSRTGACNSWFDARHCWNSNMKHKDLNTLWGYEIQSQEWGYEFVTFEIYQKTKKKEKHV